MVTRKDSVRRQCFPCSWKSVEETQTSKQTSGERHVRNKTRVNDSVNCTRVSRSSLAIPTSSVIKQCGTKWFCLNKTRGPACFLALNLGLQHEKFKTTLDTLHQWGGGGGSPQGEALTLLEATRVSKACCRGNHYMISAIVTQAAAWIHPRQPWAGY